MYYFSFIFFWCFIIIHQKGYIIKKKIFDLTLKEIQLSKQDFSNLTSVAYSTIGNWNDEKKPIPGWVESWLKLYIKSKDMDKIVEAVKPHING